MPPNPENPDFYNEHTQAANYGDGYYDSPPPEPPTPWYRRPLALIIAGVAGAGLLALAVAGVYVLVSKPGEAPTPAPTTTSSPAATTTTAAESPRRHPPGGGGGGAPTQTVTETAPPSTDTPTTTVPTTTVPASTAPPSTETSTVTQTVTVPTRRPFERP